MLRSVTTASPVAASSTDRVRRRTPRARRSSALGPEHRRECGPRDRTGGPSDSATASRARIASGLAGVDGERCALAARGSARRAGRSAAAPAVVHGERDYRARVTGASSRRPRNARAVTLPERRPGRVCACPPTADPYAVVARAAGQADVIAAHAVAAPSTRGPMTDADTADHATAAGGPARRHRRGRAAPGDRRTAAASITLPADTATSSGPGTAVPSRSRRPTRSSSTWPRPAAPVDLSASTSTPTAVRDLRAAGVVLVVPLVSSAAS